MIHSRKLPWDPPQRSFHVNLVIIERGRGLPQAQNCSAQACGILRGEAHTQHTHCDTVCASAFFVTIKGIQETHTDEAAAAAATPVMTMEVLSRHQFEVLGSAKVQGKREQRGEHSETTVRLNFAY